MARLAAAVLVLVAAPAFAGTDFDQRKAEELRLRREHRRAVESYYTQCLREAPSSKCLPESAKFGEKRLASLHRIGQNTHTFQPY